MSQDPECLPLVSTTTNKLQMLTPWTTITNLCSVGKASWWCGMFTVSYIDYELANSCYTSSSSCLYVACSHHTTILAVCGSQLAWGKHPWHITYVTYANAPTWTLTHDDVCQLTAQGSNMSLTWGLRMQGCSWVLVPGPQICQDYSTTLVSSKVHRCESTLDALSKHIVLLH